VGINPISVRHHITNTEANNLVTQKKSDMALADHARFIR
jgi:hypothetical protein